MRNLALIVILTALSSAAFAGDNTVSVLGGYGPTGQTVMEYYALPHKGINPDATAKLGALYGVEYERRIELISIGAQVLSNGVVMGKAGINF